jgi:hypothetical protein
MNKSIILSVSQEEALNILNCKQTALLRKRIPKDYKGWVYGYVGKGKPYLYTFANLDYGISDEIINQQYHISLNQTIPFKFKLNDYIIYEREEELNVYQPKREEDFNKCSGAVVLRKLNTSREDFKKYGNGKDLYVLKIDDLTIFDKPMQLNDFIVDFVDSDTDINGNEVDWYKLPIPLSTPPKTYQYVWVKEGE